MAAVIVNNSPTPGYISWSGVSIHYDGTLYAVADGATCRKYVFWRLASPAAFQTSDAKPAIDADDCIVFVNNGGIAHSVLTSQTIHGDLLVDGSIGAQAIAAGAILAQHIRAGAIDAEHIVAGAIKAEHISAESIEAIHIVAEAIQAGHISVGAVTAEKIAVEQLAAIAANLGEIRAGKLYSFDYEAGVSGFSIDLDSGAIVNEAGDWSIGSDGSVEFKKGLIGGITLADSGLYTGDGVWGGSTTPYYFDKNGRFSLKNLLLFDPTEGLHLGVDLKVDEDNRILGSYTRVGGTESFPIEGSTQVNSSGYELGDRISDTLFLARKNYFVDNGAHPIGLAALVTQAEDGLLEVLGSTGLPEDGTILAILHVQTTKALVLALLKKADYTLDLVAYVLTVDTSLYTLSFGTKITIISNVGSVYGGWTSQYDVASPFSGIWGKADRTILFIGYSHATNVYGDHTGYSYSITYDNATDAFGTPQRDTTMQGKIVGAVRYSDNKLIVYSYSSYTAHRTNYSYDVLLSPSSAPVATQLETNTLSGSTLIAGALNNDGTLLTICKCLGGTQSFLQTATVSNGVLSWNSPVGFTGERLATPISCVRRDAAIVFTSSVRIKSFSWGSTLVSEKLGVGIEEIGSNSNGSYIKLSDGTLICYGIFVGAATNANHKNSEISLPVAFYDTNYVINGLRTDDPNWTAGEFVPFHCYAIDTDTASLYFVDRLARTIYCGISIRWFALGRWKV